MQEWIRKTDYTVLIYKKEDSKKYEVALKALTETKKASGWNRVMGVTVLKDCRIPSIYHGDDLAIIMERDNGIGDYNVKLM